MLRPPGARLGTLLGQRPLATRLGFATGTALALHLVGVGMLTFLDRLFPLMGPLAGRSDLAAPAFVVVGILLPTSPYCPRAGG
jgi:hypothetical protein